jgi:hypothetical protein
MREILLESRCINGWTSSASQAVFEVLMLEIVNASELGSLANTLDLANYRNIIKWQ